MATTQRERNAAQAREKMEARREDADGAAGWVAERAGQWDLEGVDDTFMDRQKYLSEPADGSLVPDGDRGLGAPARFAGAADRHPLRQRQAVLAGRKGFIRMAIRAGVPIVPIATSAGPIRCRCSPAGGGSRRRCSSTRSRG